jgi:hypothetical protein
MNNMSSRESSAYRRVMLPASRRDKLKAIGILMDSGQSFTAISKNEYYVSFKQCQTLEEAGISYKKL